MDAVSIVSGEVRELVRREGIDPSRDADGIRRLVESAVADYDERSLMRPLPPLVDHGVAVKRILDELAGFGALQAYLDDPQIEEVWINEPGKVFVARSGVSELTTTILTAQEVRDLVERMLKSSGRRVDLSSPFVDAALPDGSRLHVVIPDITRHHWVVNIRKFVVRATSLDDLVALGTLTPQMASFLNASVLAGLNILVSGGTQAGKTTLLNGLLGAVPARERVISCEEVFELRVPARDTVAMQCRQPSLEGTGEIGLRRLIKEALRMRPDRIVVGEVRQAESLDLLLALNSGLPGLCSLHANSAREAVLKMCTLPLLAGENVSSRFVVPTVANSVDLVVHIQLDADGCRRVSEVIGLSGRVEADVIETTDIFARRGHRVARADGFPPRPERFERVGIDIAAILAGGVAIGMGGLIGLTAGMGLFCLWWACWTPVGERGSRPRGVTARGRERGRELLARADLPSVSPATLTVTALGLGLTAFIGVFAVCGVPAIAVSFAVIAGWMPFGAVLGRARRRRERYRNLWPEVVDNLASGVRAGLSLPEALGQVGDRGPEPLRPPFVAFARLYRTTGNFEVAVDDLKERLADPVGDRICEALRITREVGGSDLGRLLRSLSSFLREDARTRSELETRQSWTVSAARLAVASPWVVLALLATRSESVAAYGRPAGAVVLLVGGLTSVVAYRMMLLLGRLPEETRVLR